MRSSERTSFVLVGLVGLLSMMSIAFAEDRDELRRVKAANATFVAIDPPIPLPVLLWALTPPVPLSVAMKVVSTGIRAALCETGSASSPQ
jgi:hypothetical protein